MCHFYHALRIKFVPIVLLYVEYFSQFDIMSKIFLCFGLGPYPKYLINALQGYKTLFIFKSTEHETSTAHK